MLNSIPGARCAQGPRVRTEPEGGAGRIEGGPAQVATIYTAVIENAEEFGPECAPKPGIFLGAQKSAKLERVK